MASPYLGELFLMCVLLISFVEKVELDLQLSLSECCQLGINWQNEGLKCHKYPKPVLDVPESDQESCLKTIQLCCERNDKHKQCEKGISTSKAKKVCPTGNTDGCKYLEKQCCEGCELGTKLGESKGVCSSVEDLLIEEEVKKAMLECCLEINPPAKNIKKPKIPENNQSITPETENFDEYGIPSPDNLCDYFPDQLCTQICVPNHGSYYCKCEEGYILMEDGKTCQKDTAQPTKQKPNYTPTPKVLLPNPEKPVPLHKPKEKPVKPYKPTSPTVNQTCEEAKACEQECENTKTGYKCGCRAGYTLDVDEKSCNDINECLNDSYVCDAMAEECVNEIGGYRCVKMETTTEKIFTTTIPTTTTTTTTTTRTTTTTTTTTPAPTTIADKFTLNFTSPVTPTKSYPIFHPRASKKCPKGFLDVSNGCIDIDECDEKEHPEMCEPNQVCINTLGSYKCRCKTGFQENPITHQCDDINECQTNSHNCVASQRCDNTVGSFQCIRLTGCGTGYTLNSQNGQCEDDDECALGTDNCLVLGANYICRNTLGSFRCEKKRCLPGDNTCDPEKQCPTGYMPNERGICSDIDECATGNHTCRQFADLCINRVGGYECRKLYDCPRGFEPAAFGCTDINECTSNKHKCKGLAECQNEIGSYNCKCPIGYQLNQQYSCEDVNECNFYMCPFNSKCVNLPGSYRCNCNIGFKNKDDRTCIDVDECEFKRGICDHNCYNIYGSYRCTCNNGFRLNENNRTCDDLNECDIFKDQSLCIGICVNIPGSFTCKCPPGYVLGPDGRSCEDIDECINNPCKEKDDICLNTKGSFKCYAVKCPPEFVKDPEQKNRCKRKQLFCREHETECKKLPITITFNYITFTSMLPIPPSGYLDLFTVGGPPMRMESHFSINLLSARAAQNVKPADIGCFRFRRAGYNRGSVALVKSIAGPQEIELEISVKLYNNGYQTSSHIAKLVVHVSEFEY